MKQDKQKIKDYARNLFLEVDGEGKQIYSTRKIAEKIQQKFSKTIHSTTVLNWAKKGEWEKLFIKSKVQGVQKANESIDKQETKLLDKKSDEIANIIKQCRWIKDTMFNKIVSDMKNDKELNENTIVQLLKYSTDIILNINDMPQNETVVNVDLTVNDIKLLDEKYKDFG